MADNSTLDAYLNDHRAGATGALHLIRRMQDAEDTATPTAFLKELGDRVEADLARSRTSCRVSASATMPRSAAGWVGEHLSRLRLSLIFAHSKHLSHVLEPETISMGSRAR